MCICRVSEEFYSKSPAILPDPFIFRALTPPAPCQTGRGVLLQVVARRGRGYRERD